MRKKSFRNILFLFVLFLLTFYPTLVYAKTNDNQVVEPNKIWTIKFNKEIQFDYDANQGIAVYDSKGNTVKVSLELGADNKSILVKPPVEGYTNGEKYTLNIDSSLKSSIGKSLKKDILLFFNIIEKKVNIKSAQGILSDKIIVGSSGAYNGVYTFIGEPYYDAMNAYFKELNEKGGIGGKKIELKVLEDEFKPENTIFNVQKLIDDEKVFAIVGLFGTPGVKASTSMIADAGIPAVYFATGDDITTRSGSNFFPVQPNYFYEGKLMSMYARDYFKSKKIAVIYRIDDVGVDGLAGFEAGAKELGTDSNIVAKLPIDVGSTDAIAQIAKIKKSGADLIIASAFSGELSSILKEVEKAGLNVPILTTYSNVSDSFIAVNKPVSPNAIKNLYGLGWVDTTRPAVTEFVEVLHKHYPETIENAYALSGWIAAETFTKGLELAYKDNGNTFEGLSWERYISSMENLDYKDGILKRIAYPNGERNGATNMAVAKVDGYTWKYVTEFKEFTK